MRLGNTTSNSDGQMKNKLNERHEGLYNVVLWFTCERFVTLNPRKKKIKYPPIDIRNHLNVRLMKNVT